MGKAQKVVQLSQNEHGVVLSCLSGSIYHLQTQKPGERIMKRPIIELGNNS